MTQTFTIAQPDEPWTTERLRKLIMDNPSPPAPLNGATTLYVHPTRVGDADRINKAARGRLHIQQSENASREVIAGFKGDDCVLIIGREKQNV
jgi:hypothetical protein